VLSRGSAEGQQTGTLATDVLCVRRYGLVGTPSHSSAKSCSSLRV
jgi:hypothetical protein